MYPLLRLTLGSLVTAAGFNRWMHPTKTYNPPPKINNSSLLLNLVTKTHKSDLPAVACALLGLSLIASSVDEALSTIEPPSYLEKHKLNWLSLDRLLFYAKELNIKETPTSETQLGPIFSEFQRLITVPPLEELNRLSNEISFLDAVWTEPSLSNAMEALACRVYDLAHLAIDGISAPVAFFCSFPLTLAKLFDIREAFVVTKFCIENRLFFTTTALCFALFAYHVILPNRRYT